MIKSMNFKTSRKWREKSPDADAKGKGHRQSPPPRRVVAWKDKNEDEQRQKQQEKERSKRENTQKQPVIKSRHNRSSNFTKFKYPQQYHYGSSASRVNFLERNIPQCLRRGPRYANQPVRQNCNFNPVNSVTHLKWHSIRSNSLPGYKGPAIPKAPSVVASEPDDHTKDAEAEGDDEWSNGPRTGSYEYVYQGKAEGDSQVLFGEDLAEEDEMYADELNNNQTPREAVISVLNSEGESDAESVAEEEPQPVQNQRSIPAPEIAEEVEDEIPECVDDDQPTKTGLYKSSLPKESEIATGYLDYQDYAEEVPEEKDNHSVAESVKSSKSSRSVRSSSSKSRSRKSSKSSSHSLKYGDTEINEILGSDDDSDDLIDQYMATLKTPRAESGRASRMEDGRMSRMNEERDGRFSRLGGEEVTRDSKFRKSVRIHEPRNSLSDEIPEDQEDSGSANSFDMKNLPPLSMLGSGGPEPSRRRVVRPTTAVQRFMEEDEGF